MNGRTKIQKFINYFCIVVYVSIITMTFSSDTALPKIVSMSIIPIAFCVLLVKADFDNLEKFYVFPACLTFALIIIYSHSIIIWLASFEEIKFISQGSQKLLFQIVNVIVAFCAVYIFGSKAIDYTLYGAVVMNSIKFVTALMTFGISKSWADFIYAIKTGEQVGFMTAMEIHNITYVYGFFILYYIFVSDYPKKKKAFLIGICVMYMVLGFKRIIFASMLISLCLTAVFRILPKNLRLTFGRIICGVTAIVAFLYIPLISTGLFEKLMNMLNIDTMSRIGLYNFVRPTYEFTPKYFGRGLEFVIKYMQTKLAMNESVNGIKVGIFLIHNDILVRYIEMGFFGFIGWLYFMCGFVFEWFRKHCGVTVAVMYAVMNTCNFINFSVGNTNRDYCVRLVIEVILFATIYKLAVEDKQKETKAPTVGGVPNG